MPRSSGGWMEPHCCDTSIWGRIYVIMCGCNISTAILEYEKILDISIFEKKSGDSVSTSTAPPPWWVILVAGSASLSVKSHDIGLNISTKMTEGTRICQNDKKILPGIPLKMESLLDRSTIMNLTRARCAHPTLPSTHTQNTRTHNKFLHHMPSQYPPRKHSRWQGAPPQAQSSTPKLQTSCPPGNILVTSCHVASLEDILVTGNHRPCKLGDQTRVDSGVGTDANSKRRVLIRVFPTSMQTLA